MSDYADGYVTVEERCRQFFEQYPTGSLRPANPDKPFEFVHLDDTRAQDWTAAYGGNKWGRFQPTCFVVYTAVAYRTPDDPTPGIGVAWEPFPGLTPYTHNSEIMNAETSAWGRAIVAVGAAEARASRQEVVNRRGEEDHAPAEQTVRDAALSHLEKQVARLEGPGLDEWDAWKESHQKPLWSKSVASIREAGQFVGTVLAGLGLDPFLNTGTATGDETPAGDSVPPLAPAGGPS